MEERKGHDALLIFTVMVLLSIGVVMVYSASSIFAAERYGSQYYFLKKQGMAVGIGVLIMLVAASINYEHYKKLAYPMLVLAIIFLICIFIPGIGVKVKGSSRWINLGFFRFQPSEFAKLAVIFYLAHSISKRGENIRSFSSGFLPHVMTTGAVCLLIFVQPDLGSTIIIGAILWGMLYVGGVKARYLLMPILAAFVVVKYFLRHLLNDYQLRRLLSFLDPWADPSGAGFQIIQSFYAFGSGGITGVGFGNGRQKLFYLPEPHTDFILSVIAEELGFLGVCCVLALFFIIVYKGFKIASETDDMFGCLLAFGLTLLIGIQAVVNAGVVMGALPTKGLVLPFISYGRTAIFVNLFAVGVLLNISSKKRSW